MGKILLLKKFRKAFRMTQKDVAKALNLSQSQYSRIELETCLPNADQILQLSKLFKCTPNDLFGLSGALSVVIDPLFEDYKKLVKKIKKE